MSSGNMSSVSSLGNDKVWLEKSKYDAAEQRYYNKLAKSSEAIVRKVKPVHWPTQRYKHEIRCCGPESVPLNCDCNLNIPCLRSMISSSDEDEDNGKLKRRPEPIFARSYYNDSDEEEKSLFVRRPTYPYPMQGYCRRYEEEKKTNPIFRDCTSSMENSNVPKKLNKSEGSLPKAKGHNKSKASNEKNKKQETSTEKKISVIEPVSEVVKLKGFYLQSKYLPHQPDSLQNKGTNVNTIPEISKISPCSDKSKNTQNSMKKVPVIPNPLPDKQHSVDPIIPSDSTNDPQIEDQIKKDSKKKKRHRKDRQRKQDISQNNTSGWSSIASEVAKARQHIKNSLACIDDIAVTSNTVSVDILSQVKTLEKDNVDLKNEVKELADQVKKMDIRITTIEKSTVSVPQPTAVRPQAPLPPQRDNGDDDDDDGVDLFGSDSEEEDAEAAKLKEARLAEYAAKKAGKKPVIAKSSIILDVKPWDDETNMKELEKEVRKITCDGLVWGTSKLVPLAYGIHKLQISCCVEDEKVSVDWLQDTIQEIEDYVQSVDIAAFNKV